MQHHRGRHFILHMKKKAGTYETVALKKQTKQQQKWEATCERKTDGSSILTHLYAMSKKTFTVVENIPDQGRSNDFIQSR